MPDRPTPPEMLLALWDLRPEVAVANQRFIDGYYSDAVRVAAEAYVARVRDIARASGVDTASTSTARPMIDKMFGRQGQDNAPFAWNARSSGNEQSENLGLSDLARGMVSALRNPYSHGYERPMPARKALLWLGFISVMHEELDGAGRVAAGGG